MSPSPYLLRVLSKPTQVDESTWQKWYIEEHIPEVVNAGLATRGALLRANNDFALKTKTPPKSGDSKLHNVQLSHFDELPADKTFCAVYQTDLEKPMDSDKLNAVSTTGKLLDGKEHMSCAEWDIRVYKLIQDYDPDNLGDGALKVERRAK